MHIIVAVSHMLLWHSMFIVHASSAALTQFLTMSPSLSTHFVLAHCAGLVPARILDLVFAEYVENCRRDPIREFSRDIGASERAPSITGDKSRKRPTFA